MFNSVCRPVLALPQFSSSNRFISVGLMYWVIIEICAHSCSKSSGARYVSSSGGGEDSQFALLPSGRSSTRSGRHPVPHCCSSISCLDASSSSSLPSSGCGGGWSWMLLPAPVVLPRPDWVLAIVGGSWWTASLRS